MLKALLLIQIPLVGYGALKGASDFKLSRYRYNDKKQINNDLSSEIFEKRSVITESSDTIEERRKKLVDKLENTNYDLVIIGGGCSGSGALNSAVNRGMKVCLIEKHDFSSGTSSRSTKIAHGGIRYLQEAVKLNYPIENFNLVYETLKERNNILKAGPFLNNIVKISIHEKNPFLAYYYYLGICFYHFVYLLSIRFQGIVFPGPEISFDVRTKAFNVSLFEGQIIDTRLNILTMLSNQAHNTNSDVANYVELIDYVFEPDSKIIKHIICKDRLTNQIFNISAKAFANCTGIWADLCLEKSNKLTNGMVSGSKGTHIVVKKSVFPTKFRESGIMIPGTTDGRILFILPYLGKYLIGTTDSSHEKTHYVKPIQDEIDWIVTEVSKRFNIPKNDISENITSSWSGIRPLVNNFNDKKVDKSTPRVHSIYNIKGMNMFTLMGGKWTSYLKTGEELIEKAVDEVESLHSFRKTPFQMTYDTLRIRGSICNNSHYYHNLHAFEQLTSTLICDYPLIPQSYIQRLVNFYGINSYFLLKNGEKNRTNVPICQSLHSQFPIFLSELDYCIDNEFVAKPNDFLLRRTSLGFIDQELAKYYVPAVVSHMKGKLGWDEVYASKEERESIESLAYMM